MQDIKAEEKLSWLQKLKAGLSKTSSKISTGISDIFTKRKLDKEALEELQDLLITSDISLVTAEHICNELAKQKFEKDVDDVEVKETLADIIENIFVTNCRKIEETKSALEVILVCGVNGNGKTTTVAKLANLYKNNNKKVLLAACDTFRAAAVEQLEIWANRVKVELLKGELNSDPASVAYKAVEKAMQDGYDTLFIDTAGRLHNKTNLMDEFAKIIRVIKKISPEAPHKILLVLDGTTGQNAHMQLEAFSKIVEVSGLVVTKLDGTAKGGVVISLAQKYKTPIYAIGVGEGVDDLRLFDAGSFAKSVVGI